MMLHNIKQILDEFLLQKIHGPDIILCANPFLKSVFLEKLTHQTHHGVIYLDFDMLYGGYINSGVFNLPTNVLIRCPSLFNWKEEVTSIVQTISTDKYLIIIDSLNGMMTTFEHKRLTFHSIMLMSSLGVNVNTRVVVAAITKKPTQKRKILGNHNAFVNTTYTLEMADDTVRLTKVA